jgi:hypothetical protein
MNSAVASIQDEMASAVRLLGGQGGAKSQNRNAARASGLPETVIERLRWRKVKRVPADIADTIRAAVERHNQKGLARAEHEIAIARRQAEIMAQRLAAVDPDFFGPDIDALRRVNAGRGLSVDRVGEDNFK